MAVRWLIALGAVVIGILLGSLGAGIARRVIGRSRREPIRMLAGPVASGLLSLLAGAGLVVGLGIASPESVEPLPDKLIAFVPRLLLSILVVLAGNAVATLAANAVGLSAARATGRPQHALVRILKAAILAAAVIIAVQQLGLDTRLADTLVAGVVGCVAVSVALLTGFGGRAVASELAAGRYVRRLLHVGDLVTIGEVHGRVVRLHGATIELATRSDDLTPSEAGTPTGATVVAGPAGRAETAANPTTANPTTASPTAGDLPDPTVAATLPAATVVVPYTRLLAGPFRIERGA
jgi:hypothetical protein